MVRNSYQSNLPVIFMVNLHKTCSLCIGSFKNYVDKMRWVGGQKLQFWSTFRVKTVLVEVGRWSKQGIIMSKYVK